jgi:uncharacterized protein (TIGR02118 family)
MKSARGVMALGDDRATALELGRELARSPAAQAVVVHVALPGQDRRFVSALRAIGPVEDLAKALEPMASHGIWEAEFRSVRSHGRSESDGQPTPGVGMLFGIWRRPGLSHAEFDTHWRDVHAPLALKHHVAMWDYTQCSFRRALTGSSVDYDGVAICQFPTIEALEQRFFASPEGERAINEDVVRFGDPARLDRVRMTEYMLR